MALSSVSWAVSVWRRSDGSNARVQVNNDYNAGTFQAKRQTVRFPLTIDLIDQISWNDMSKATNYKVYSEAALIQVLGNYAGSSLFLEHQMKKGNKSYYFTVTAGGEESSAVEVVLP